MTKILKILPHRYQAAQARKSDGLITYAKFEIEGLGVRDFRAGDVVKLSGADFDTRKGTMVRLSLDAELEITDEAFARIAAEHKADEDRRAKIRAENAEIAAKNEAELYKQIEAAGGTENAKNMARKVVANMTVAELAFGDVVEIMGAAGVSVTDVDGKDFISIDEAQESPVAEFLRDELPSGEIAGLAVKGEVVSYNFSYHSDCVPVAKSLPNAKFNGVSKKWSWTATTMDDAKAIIEGVKKIAATTQNKAPSF